MFRPDLTPTDPLTQHAPMDITERRELNRGLGDGLARAFELAAVPAIFGAGGWLLDRWLGTAPVFTLVLAMLGFVGKLLAMWYHYAATMDHLQDQATTARTPSRRGPAPTLQPPSDSGPATLPTGVKLEGP
jgi:F0F1-type ATP synthase assembly protein I